jgi:hypothetical protein
MAKPKVWTPEEVYAAYAPVKTSPVEPHEDITPSHPVVKFPASVPDFSNAPPANECKRMATTTMGNRRGKVVPIVVARLTDPKSSHLAATKIPTEKLWERMLIIRKLVLAHPGHCIRWYVNVLAEQIPAPELDAPGCRDSAGKPRHDMGFYGIWATLFAQSVKHGLIMKVTDPLTPTETLMQRSPYPGESLVHIYEACTAANLQRMECERKDYFERAEAQKAADREAKATVVAQQRLAKNVAKSVQEEIEDRLGTDAGQSGSCFQTI